MGEPLIEVTSTPKVSSFISSSYSIGSLEVESSGGKEESKPKNDILCEIKLDSGLSTSTEPAEVTDFPFLIRSSVPGV